MILRRLIRSVNGGTHILVVLHFVRAGNVAMVVPVMPRAQWFSTYSPAPLLVSPSPSRHRDAHRRRRPPPATSPTPVAVRHGDYARRPERLAVSATGSNL